MRWGQTEAAVAHSEEQKATQPTPAKKRAAVQQLMRAYYRVPPSTIAENKREEMLENELCMSVVKCFRTTVNGGFLLCVCQMSIRWFITMF